MSWLTHRRLLTFALVAWGTLALIGLVGGPVLGHDEAAFALVARGDTPLATWLYRSVGTVGIAKIGIALGGADWQLRLISVVLNAQVPVAAYAVGRVAFSARTGAWAAAVLAGTHPMVLRSAELLSDLPAVACILAGVAVLISELPREGGPRWRVVLAGPLFAAAFYLRYGSTPVVVIALAAAVVLWWPAVVRRPGRLLVMFGSLAVLLIPHLLHSRDATGTALGILKLSAGMPRQEYVGDGLVTYLTSNPFMYYGFLTAPVMVAGLAGLIRERRKVAWYLAAVALGQVVVLGLESHGQPRYVFVATALLVVLGVEVVARHRLVPARVAFAAVVASWLSLVIVEPIYFRHVDTARAPLIEAANLFRARRDGRPCAVIALIVPQLMWYSGCEVYAAGLVRAPLPADHDRYAVSFARWPIVLPEVLAIQHLDATSLPVADPRAEVWLLH